MIMGSVKSIMSGSTSNATAIPFKLEKSFQTLYSEDNAEDGPKTTQVVIMPTSTIQLTSNLPIPSRFPYQHLASALDSQTLARMFLQLVGQMTGMVTGNLPLVLFDLDEKNSPKRKHAHRLDAIRTFRQLAPESRPKLSFVARPGDVAACVPHGGSISVPNPMDFLMDLRHTIDPDIHYDLLSKRTLAVSGLPTPPSQVIDTELSSSDVQDKSAVAAEVERMLGQARCRALPFVVKLPQALSATGTFLVRNETERRAALAALGPETARMLAAITPENEHLKPTSLILQELIPGPGVGLSLFVTISGRWEFISCTRQIFDTSDGTPAWNGGYISYLEQDSLCQMYADTADKLARYVHERGYHGPIGVDVMTGPDGSQYIVDMNVRIAGTMPLGFWKEKFLSRGFHEAALFFPFLFALSRDEFEERFRGELQAGRIVEVGWSHDVEGKTSATILMVAGSTKEELDNLIKTLGVYKLKK
jgi:hypothetical protein